MGQLVSGVYELITTVGRGPTGTVWRAEHRGTREAFAVKLLDARFAADTAVVDRFVRERHVLAAYLHPALIRVRELVTETPDLALVMELVAGSDLRRQLARSGPLVPEAAGQIGAACADALSAAHANGVVHCDIKPANLLMTREWGEVRITDCRVTRLTRGHREGVERFADPAYAAPEVILGGPPVPASDMYGLGLVMYEMLTGVSLCHGDDPASVLAQHLRGRPVVPTSMPRALRDLLEDCLAIDPAARPTAAELADELRRIMPTDAPLPALPPSAGRWSDSGAPRPVAAPAAPSGRRDRAEQPRPAVPGRRSVTRPILVGGAVLVVAAVIGLIIASLPAANGGQRGTPAATAAPTAGATVRTSGTAPLLSPGAKAYTVDGAIAFVRYWFAALNFSTATGSLGSLSAASSPDCNACKAALQAVQTGYQNGRHLLGGGYTLRDVTTDSFFNLAQAKLGVVYDRAPRSTVSSGGQQSDSVPGVNFVTGQVLLERVGDQWRVREVLSSSPVA